MQQQNKGKKTYRNDLEYAQRKIAELKKESQMYWQWWTDAQQTIRAHTANNEWAEKLIESLKTSNKWYYDYCMQLLNGKKDLSLTEQIKQNQQIISHLQVTEVITPSISAPQKKKKIIHLICVKEGLLKVFVDGEMTDYSGNGLVFLDRYTTDRPMFKNDEGNWSYHIIEFNESRLAERFIISKNPPKK